MARRGAVNGNGKRLASQQSVNAVVKSICDIMRRSNCAGALQYVPELTWILFLRILDEREMREAEAAEAVGSEFQPSLERGYRWQDWAAPDGPKRQALGNATAGSCWTRACCSAPPRRLLSRPSGSSSTIATSGVSSACQPVPS
jgi:type I restriction enzyme M protein